MKLVSLLPSATEIVCELGLSSSLVGISHECDYPENIAHLPHLTASSINTQGKSRAIHQSVEDLLKNTLSVYDLDLELLKTLQPDTIITQDICDVCAIPFAEVEKGCQQVLDNDVSIISLKPHRLNDIWQDMAKVAKSLGRMQDFAKFESSLHQRMQHIQKKIQSSGAPKKSVLTIEWMDPVMIGGMWVPEMIDIVGGEYLFAEPGQHARTVSAQQLREINPDVVVIKPCGFKLEQTVRELDTLRKTIPWESWQVTQSDRVFLVDGNAYFNRPGPRILDSLEILAHCAHPALFPEFAKTYQNAFIRLTPDLKLPHPA